MELVVIIQNKDFMKQINSKMRLILKQQLFIWKSSYDTEKSGHKCSTRYTNTAKHVVIHKKTSQLVNIRLTHIINIET